MPLCLRAYANGLQLGIEGQPDQQRIAQQNVLLPIPCYPGLLALQRCQQLSATCSAARLRFERRALRAVADQRQVRVGPTAPEEREGLKQISDTGALEAIVDEVLANNAKSVEQYRAGKEAAINALIGQCMKASKGKANPAQVTELLKQKLAG